MSLEELFSPPSGTPSGAPAGGGFAARIADTAVAPTDELRVVIPAFGTDHYFGPAPFTPRGDLLPQAGDTALVVFDDEGAAWIVSWRST